MTTGLQDRPRFHDLRAVVFDLDGTLVHSLPDIAAAANAALSEAGFAALDEDAIAGMIGNGSKVLITRALAAAKAGPGDIDEIEQLHDDFLAAYERVPCERTHLYPGARPVLEELAAHGVKLGICTNKPEEITARVLAHLGIERLFGSVVGGNATDPLKPAPHMLLRVLNNLGVAAQASVMVGDSRADAGAARAAGTRLILLRHGYCRDDLDMLGADVVLPGFEKLSDALTRMVHQDGASLPTMR